jgi:hypothetical protein
MIICAAVPNSRIPHLEKVINEGVKEVINSSQRWFIRAWNNPSKENVLCFVSQVGREIETNETNQSNGDLLASLFVTKRVEEVDRKGKDITAFSLPKTEVPPIRALEITKGLSIKDVPHVTIL